MRFDSISEYKTYIIETLKNTDLTNAKASYDTGFGLHITDEYLGEQTHALDVVGASIVKLLPPNGLNSSNYSDVEKFDSDWDVAWQWCQSIVRAKLMLIQKKGA